MSPSKTDLQALKSKYLENLNWLETEFDQRVASLRIAARDLGSCYEKAYQNHLDIIKDQKEFSALAADACFAVLSMFCAGGLSVLSSLAQRSMNHSGNLLMEGMEDAFQTGAEGGMQFSAKLVAATPPQPVSKLPLNFQNDLLNEIDRENRTRLAFINDIRREVNDRNLQAFAGVNTDRQMLAFRVYLAVLDARYSQIELSEAQKTSLIDEMEIGMWTKWVLKNCVVRHYYRTLAENRFLQAKYKIVSKTGYVDPGTVIEDYFSKG